MHSFTDGNMTPESSPTKLQINVESPVCRKGTMEYYKRKCELYEEKLNEYSVEPITPDEVPAFLAVDKVKVPKKKRSMRITQVHGSMEGSKILELREAAENEQREKEKLKEDKKLKKATQRDIYLSCKEQYVCTNNKCLSSGLKQCSVCGFVLKSNCAKKGCTVNGIKPKMLLCHFDLTRRTVKKN